MIISYGQIMQKGFPSAVSLGTGADSGTYSHCSWPRGCRTKAFVFEGSQRPSQWPIGVGHASSGNQAVTGCGDQL